MGAFGLMILLLAGTNQSIPEYKGIVYSNGKPYYVIAWGVQRAYFTEIYDYSTQTWHYFGVQDHSDLALMKQWYLNAELVNKVLY